MKQPKLTSPLLAVALLLAGASASAADSYAEDRAAIEDLQGRYLFAMDWRDADAYAATFTEDGVLDYAGGVAKGREQIRAVINNMRKNEAERRAKDTSGKWPPRGRHNVTNLVLRIDGNKATARSYWTQFGNNNAERSAGIGSYGHYEDELVKQNGKWLFTKRTIFNEVLEKRHAADGNPAAAK
jgi:ketosteroid isomerase-like protein